MQPQGITYVYNGPGSWQVSVEQTYDMLQNKIDSRSIKYTDSVVNIEPEATLFVVPGGVAYDITSVSATQQKVTDFVRNGGSYLGICAGAIAASKTIIGKPVLVLPKELEASRLQQRDMLWSHQTTYDDGFGLLDTPCVLRHVVKVPGDSGHVKNFCAVSVKMGADVFKSCLYSGPAFIHLPPEANVLLGYENPVSLFKLNNIKNQTYSVDSTNRFYDAAPAAVFASSFGKGRYVLSGVHLELNPETFDTDAATYGFEGKFPKEVAECEEKRQVLLEKMFDALHIT